MTGLELGTLSSLVLHTTALLLLPSNTFFFVSGAHSLWEFPVLTLKYGGVVFILVYLTMFLILGAPMLLLEMALGQYGGLAPTKLFRNLCPVRLIACSFNHDSPDNYSGWLFNFTGTDWSGICHVRLMPGPLPDQLGSHHMVLPGTLHTLQ